jgi:hypothetical protein
MLINITACSPGDIIITGLERERRTIEDISVNEDGSSKVTFKLDEEYYTVYYPSSKVVLRINNNGVH